MTEGENKRGIVIANCKLKWWMSFCTNSKKSNPFTYDELGNLFDTLETEREMRCFVIHSINPFMKKNYKLTTVMIKMKNRGRMEYRKMHTAKIACINDDTGKGVQEMSDIFTDDLDLIAKYVFNGIPKVR